MVAVPPRPRPSQLGWPTIRAANAEAGLSLSAETSRIKGRWGRLDHRDAIGRLLRAAPAPTASRSERRYALPWTGTIAPEVSAFSGLAR